MTVKVEEKHKKPVERDIHYSKNGLAKAEGPNLAIVFCEKFAAKLLNFEM